MYFPIDAIVMRQDKVPNLRKCRKIETVLMILIIVIVRSRVYIHDSILPRSDPKKGLRIHSHAVPISSPLLVE